MSGVSARIERLPLFGFHKRLLVLGGLGYTFDAMDGSAVAFVLPVVRTAWNLSSEQTGLLGSSTFIGYLFGALGAGALGDLIGRRAVMMWALALYSVASVASAFSNDWPMFLATRIVAGVGTGAEAAIIAPFLTEFVAKTFRGAFTGSLAGFFSFGFILSAVLGYFIVPTTPLGFAGWRVLVIVTALPIAMLLWWRRALPESPRWLESRGRHAEAEAIVAAMEAEFARGGKPLLPPTEVEAAAGASTGTLRGNYAALFVPGQARLTVMTWMMWLSITFSYYAFFTWIPGLLVQNGMSIVRSFGYSIAIFVAQAPGYFSAAWFNERIGRQATVATYMGLGAVSALGLAFAQSNEHVLLIGICLSFFMNGTYAGVYTYTAELFPTAARTTGMGLASAIGRIGAIVSPIAVGFIYPRSGFAGVFGTTTAILLAGVLAVLLMGVPTRGRSLEEIAARMSERRRAG